MGSLGLVPLCPVPSSRKVFHIPGILNVLESPLLFRLPFYGLTYGSPRETLKEPSPTTLWAASQALLWTLGASPQDPTTVALIHLAKSTT